MCNGWAEAVTLGTRVGVLQACPGFLRNVAGYAIIIKPITAKLEENDIMTFEKRRILIGFPHIGSIHLLENSLSKETSRLACDLAGILAEAARGPKHFPVLRHLCSGEETHFETLRSDYFLNKAINLWQSQQLLFYMLLCTWVIVNGWSAGRVTHGHMEHKSPPPLFTFDFATAPHTLEHSFMFWGSPPWFCSDFGRVFFVVVVLQ